MQVKGLKSCWHECPKTRTKSVSIKRNKNIADYYRNQSEFKVETSKLPMARKTRLTKSRLGLVLHLIGCESSLTFLEQ